MLPSIFILGSSVKKDLDSLGEMHGWNSVLTLSGKNKHTKQREITELKKNNLRERKVSFEKLKSLTNKV